MREFILPKISETAGVGVLDLEHLPQVLELQDETRAALPEAQKMFVLPQTPDYFEKLLARRNGAMVGVRVKGKLVAQMAMMGVLSMDEAVERNTITRNDVPFHHAEPTDLVVVAKSMAVHPGWRGHELSQQMLATALNLPFVRAADHVFAQISADNVRSWDLFLRSGFGIVAAALDPSDHRPRFVVQKPALGFALHERVSVDGLDPVADFAAIMRLAGREALIGRPDDGLARKLAFHASETSAAAWGEDAAGQAWA